jgi:hypothetical protein
MKTHTLIALLAGAAWAASGQTVFLKATPQGSKQSEKTTTENTGAGGFKRIVHTCRQEAIEIMLRNTSPNSVDFVVEWMFLSSPVKGGGDPQPCAADEKTLTLAANAGSAFQVNSPKLETTQTYQHTFEHGKGATGKREQREKTRPLGADGNKPAGYVIRVKAAGKIIAVDASDATLERRYQNPAAPWSPPEKAKDEEPEKPAPRKKPAKK